MKTITNQRIKIDVGTDYLEKTDKQYSFSTIEQGILRCLELSELLAKPISLVLDTNFEDGDYKIQKIATVNFNILDTSINALYKPQLSGL